ncbi:MAG: asparagine synthase (glutamine-hydrolyzing) [Alphaproteobacteria bacterium]
MCGIGGYVGDFSAEVLEKMALAMRHRGPDSWGEWRDSAAPVGIVHRRLSIIDLTAAASQPMQACGGRYVVTFNGEIYNFKDIAEDLAGAYSFNPNSDTAILAPLYDRYGADMLLHLNGIFAFAIYDTQEKTLFMARDHTGIAPFYYTQTPQGFVFASEIKALLQAAPAQRALNMAALADYVTYLWTPGEETLMAGVKKLNPGHYIKLKVGQETAEIQPKRYYWPPLSKPVDSSKTAQNLQQLFDEVVQDQCLADVPVGAFLSGGVDSSAIVASMVATGRKPKRAYCIKFNDSNTMAAEGFSDDYPFAAQIAQHLGVNLVPVEADVRGLERLPEMVKMLEEPLADLAPLYVQDIARAARADGMRVLLGGTGGDDVFTGYRRHQLAVLRQKYGVALQVGAGVASALKPVLPATLRRRVEKGAYALAASDDAAFIHRLFEFTPRDNVLKLLNNAVGKPANMLTQNIAHSAGQPLLRRVLFAEFSGFLPDHNLTYTNKAGMAESVEIRVPFLDTRVLDFAASLPEYMLIQGHTTKWILREAVKDRLPAGILNRPKAGFGAPVRRWLVADKGGFVRDTLLGQRAKARGLFNPVAVEKLLADTRTGRVDGAYTLLSLLMVELWCQAFDM